MSDGPVARIVPHEDGRHVRVEEVRFAQHGPVQVATDDYRRGWDATFAKKPEELN